MRRKGARLLAVTAFLAMMLGGGPVFAVSQPTQTNADRRAEPPSLPAGPHCHIVLVAGGNSGFDEIVTATRHQAHLRTNANAAGGVFVATECP